MAHKQAQYTLTQDKSQQKLSVGGSGEEEEKEEEEEAGDEEERLLGCFQIRFVWRLLGCGTLPNKQGESAASDEWIVDFIM